MTEADQAPETLESNDDQATDAFATLLKGEEDRKKTPTAPPESPEPVGDGAAEEPSADNEETQPVESEPSAPAIEPPVSWTAEQKERFKTLPPDIQQTIAERESERERAVNRRLQEAAETEKAAKAARETAEQERHKYAQTLEQIVPQTIKDFQDKWGKFTQADWQKLARENPASWAQAKQLYEAEQAKARDAANRLIAERQRQGQEQAEARAQYISEQNTRLMELYPEWSDRSKAETHLSKIRSYLISQNVPVERVDNLVEARLINLADKARLWDEAQSRSKQAAKSTTAPAPKPVKPGASESAKRNGKSERLADSINRLKRSGSDEDAENAFKALLAR